MQRSSKKVYEYLSYFLLLCFIVAIYQTVVNYSQAYKKFWQDYNEARAEAEMNEGRLNELHAKIDQLESLNKVEKEKFNNLKEKFNNLDVLYEAQKRQSSFYEKIIDIKNERLATCDVDKVALQNAIDEEKQKLATCKTIKVDLGGFFSVA